MNLTTRFAASAAVLLGVAQGAQAFTVEACTADNKTVTADISARVPYNQNFEFYYAAAFRSAMARLDAYDFTHGTVKFDQVYYDEWMRMPSHFDKTPPTINIGPVKDGCSSGPQ